MKSERLNEIKQLIKKYPISNQSELIKLLNKKGFDITQATLSRDFRRLKIVKSPNERGEYVYSLPSPKVSLRKPFFEKSDNELLLRGFISYDFSGQLCVIKTRPGYANGIAAEIDAKAQETVLGTIAGDDTILLIPREGVSQEDISASLSMVLNEI
ncbi:MAG: arginine repressor [Dysgonamonadaceae bacterium]|jgi:transcriptional regulator of arginine metabolism|nr:arginine repressor [Dysgonamonadaceae bacterium]